jgi:hypothetical protein
MNEVPTYLSNHESVTEAFGYWPTFHDSRVVSFQYERGDNGVVLFAVHAFEMTPDVDVRGYFKLIKHHLVKFKCCSTCEADLDQFMPANILLSLQFSSVREFCSTGKFSVILDSAMGGELSGSFCAKSGTILEVAPCDESGGLEPSIRSSNLEG